MFLIWDSSLVSLNLLFFAYILNMFVMKFCNPWRTFYLGCFYVGFSTPPLNTQSHSSSSKDVESTNVANVSTSSGDNSIMLEFKKGKLAYGVHMKNELEKYLEELKEDRDNAVFKVLERWKVSSSKFKILSLLVQDVFSILLFTVASESVFSTGWCILDPYRSPLTPKIVEALVCSQTWIQSTPLPLDIRIYIDFFWVVPRGWKGI